MHEITNACIPLKFQFSDESLRCRGGTFLFSRILCIPYALITAYHQVSSNEIPLQLKIIETIYKSHKKAAHKRRNNVSYWHYQCQNLEIRK